MKVIEKDVFYQSFTRDGVHFTLRHKGRSTFVKDIYHFKYGTNEPIVCGIRYKRKGI